MADMQTRVRYVPDVEPAAMLRDIAAAAATATGNDTPVPFTRLSDAYWDNNETTEGLVKVQFVIASVDRTTGDETYQFSVQLTDAAGGNATVVATSPVLTVAPVAFVLAFDAEMAQALITPANRVRIGSRLVVAGTTPIVSYGAWLVNSSM